MNAKFSIFVIFHIICMTVPLRASQKRINTTVIKFDFEFLKKDCGSKKKKFKVRLHYNFLTIF